MGFRGRISERHRRKGMEMSAFVGIDVSKEDLDWAVHGTSTGGQLPHTDAGLEQLVRDLRALKPKLVVLEATGGLEMSVLAVLSVAGLLVAVVNPLQIR